MNQDQARLCVASVCLALLAACGGGDPPSVDAGSPAVTVSNSARDTVAARLQVGAPATDSTRVKALAVQAAAPAGGALPTVSAGGQHTVALKADGTVWSWGANYWGQLGIGSTVVFSSIPVQVPGLSGIVRVAAARGHTVALKSDGTVWSWGGNFSGQLGTGSTSDSFVPVQVPGLSGAIEIAAGYAHTVALKADGTIWAWGDNQFGALGNNSTTNSSIPVQAVSAPSGVTGIAAGVYYTVALKSDGTVWSWGYNILGQLGNASTVNSLVAVQAIGLTGVTALSAGFHTLALTSNGTVWAWGSNSYGQLGYSIGANPSVPHQVAGLTGVASVSAGQLDSVAVMSDGTVWAWGFNEDGELGNGTTTNSAAPVLVSGLNRVTRATSNLFHMAALKTDGTVWAWGNNAYGGLGNNSTNNQSLVPVQVFGPGGAGFLNLGTAVTTIFEQIVVPQPTLTPPVATFPTRFADFLSFIGTHSTEFSPETQTYLTAAAAEAAPIHSALTKGIAASYADLGSRTASASAYVNGAAGLSCSGTIGEKLLGILPTAVLKAGVLGEDQATILKILVANKKVYELGEIVNGVVQANPLCVASKLSSLTMLGVEKLLVPALKGFAVDPPDPLYATIATPELPFIPSLPVTKDASLNAALATFVESTLKAAALLKTVNTTYDRYSTALAVGDAFSATRQLGAALKYLVAYDTAVRAGGISLAQLDAALRGKLDVNPVLLPQLQQSVALYGLPIEIAALLVDSGFSSTQIDMIKAQILKLDPAELNQIKPDTLTTLSMVFLRVSSAGDINRDGLKDQRDLQMIIVDLGKTVEASVCGTRCDLNGDGKIDHLDVRQLTSVCGLGCNRPRPRFQ